MQWTPFGTTLQGFVPELTLTTTMQKYSMLLPNGSMTSRNTSTRSYMMLTAT